MGFGLAAPQKTRKASPTRKLPVATKSSSPARKVAGTSRKRTVRRRSVASWQRGQQEPAPERYTEIQQALIAKGYLPGPATGKWGPESVDALRRFQQDQKLTPTGKLDSLSLIGLGLGPNRELSARNSQVTATPAKEEP